MKREKIITFFRYFLIALTVLNLAFIFYQSTLPREESAEQSEAVGGFLEEIFPPDTKTGKFVLSNIRKIAHFTEFFTLGIWVTLYFVFFVEKKKYHPFVFPTALLIALFDETVQIFSGRGPMISDVWIDFFGFSTSAVIIYTVYYITYIIRNKSK